MIYALQTGPLGVNTYIVKLIGSAVFIVDPASCKYSGDETKIIDYLEDNNLCPIAVVLTHGHFDHIAGIKTIKQKYKNIPILINKHDSSSIGSNSADGQQKTLVKMGLMDFIPCITDLPPADDYLFNSSKLGELKVFENIDRELKRTLNKWQILHTPGHTPGGVCLYNESDKQLITGDTIFYQSYGRTDLPGGNYIDLMHNLQKIYTSIPGDTEVYPGHDYYGFMLNQSF